VTSRTVSELAWKLEMGDLERLEMLRESVAMGVLEERAGRFSLSIEGERLYGQALRALAPTEIEDGSGSAPKRNRRRPRTPASEPPSRRMADHIAAGIERDERALRQEAA
jgi:hypothetical protein